MKDLTKLSIADLWAARSACMHQWDCITEMPDYDEDKAAEYSNKMDRIDDELFKRLKEI